MDQISQSLLNKEIVKWELHEERLQDLKDRLRHWQQFLDWSRQKTLGQGQIGKALVETAKSLVRETEDELQLFEECYSQKRAIE